MSLTEFEIPEKPKKPLWASVVDFIAFFGGFYLIAWLLFYGVRDILKANSLLGWVVYLLVVLVWVKIIIPYLFPWNRRERLWEKECQNLQKDAERELVGEEILIEKIWVDNSKWDRQQQFSGQLFETFPKKCYLRLKPENREVGQFYLDFKNIKKGYFRPDWLLTFLEAPFENKGSGKAFLAEKRAKVILSGPWQDD